MSFSHFSERIIIALTQLQYSPKINLIKLQYSAIMTVLNCNTPPISNGRDFAINFTGANNAKDNVMRMNEPSIASEMLGYLIGD